MDYLVTLWPDADFSDIHAYLLFDKTHHILGSLRQVDESAYAADIFLPQSQFFINRPALLKLESGEQGE